MPEYLSVSDAAEKVGAKPKDISDAFYGRHLDVDRCPIVAGRRLIPSDYLDGIAIELRRLGKLPPLKREVSHGR